MNIESIKLKTKEHYISKGQEALFLDKIQNFKDDILKEFKKWKEKFPNKDFEDFKQNSYSEMNGFSPENGPNLSIGIYMTALDLINPKIDLH